MAPAVANPLYMGYLALYKTVLESSKRGIAKAMRVFADKDNYPVLLHCIHGKRPDGSAAAIGHLAVPKWLALFGPLSDLYVGGFLS